MSISFTVSMNRKAEHLTICTTRSVLLYTYALTGCTNRKLLRMLK